MAVIGSPDITEHEFASRRGAQTSAAAQIKAALKRLDLLLAKGVAAAQAAYGPHAGKDGYRGLYIGPDDVAHILSREPGASLTGNKPDERATRPDLMPPPGPAGPFAALKKRFALRRFDLNLILLALAPELDTRYERLYAFLQDDVTRKRPSVDLAFALLCPSLAAKIDARRHLNPAAPLLRHHLIELIEDPAQPRSPLIKKYLKVDDRIVAFLCAEPAIDARLLPGVRHRVPQTALQSLVLPGLQAKRVAQLAREAHANRRRTVFYFQGSYGVGKQTCAEALCRELGLGLLKVDLGVLLADEATSPDLITALIEREACLQNSAVYWTGFDHLLEEKHHLWLATFLRALETGPRLTFLSGNKTWEPAGVLHAVPFTRVRFDVPAYRHRLKLWRTLLNGSRPEGQSLALETIANKFRLSGGQIKDAVATAQNLARWRKPEQALPDMQDIHAACRLQSNRNLATLAQNVRPRFGWDDIVLPADPLAQLKTISIHVRQRAQVLENWGFDRKLALGKGVNALFAGPSGTGKTMAADIIANELALELYKIDLSTVISKYIGETEKNLAKIFDEAETSNAVLFFDEADALFGKRSEVKDSHDRYANIETSYLLQRMEEYQGVSILATNLRQNMDDAFVRRIAFTIHFPMPEAPSRLAIWQKIWPPETPRDATVDLEYLAENFRFAGGNIKNIALAAAYLAAEDGQPVAMRHLVRTTREELLKMGKACVKGDFGKYYEMLGI